MNTLRGARPETPPGQPSPAGPLSAQDALVVHWVRQVIHPAIPGRDDVAVHALLAHLAWLGRTPSVLPMHAALRALGPLYPAPSHVSVQPLLQIAKVALLAAHAALTHGPGTESSDPALLQARQGLMLEAQALLQRCPQDPSASIATPASPDAWQPGGDSPKTVRGRTLASPSPMAPGTPISQPLPQSLATLEAPTLPAMAWGDGAPLVRTAARAEATPAEAAALYGPHKSSYIENYAALGFRPGARFSHLFGDAGEKLGTMTETLTAGSFGKMRLFFDGEGQKYAVKELRLQAKPGYSSRFVGRRKTRPTRAEDALEEIKLTQSIRSLIDRDREILRESRPGELDVHHLHDPSEPFEIYGTIADRTRQKLYILMTLATGDLGLLAANLHPALRPAAAFSLAAQGFMELAILHPSMAHFDLKLSNIFFNAQGKFELMDVGMAQDVDHRGRTIHTFRTIGSLAAPEFQNNQFKHLTTGVDIYALAISIFELSATTGVGRPFYLTRYLAPEGGINQESITGLFTRFEAFKREHASLTTGLVEAARIQPTGEFGALFYSLAQSHPALCELLLNKAMALDPKDRWSAAQLLEGVRGMIPELDPVAHNQMRETVAWIEENKVQPSFDEVQRYNAWHDAEAAKNAALVQAARGVARPLP